MMVQHQGWDIWNRTDIFGEEPLRNLFCCLRGSRGTWLLALVPTGLQRAGAELWGIVTWTGDFIHFTMALGLCWLNISICGEIVLAFEPHEFDCRGTGHGVIFKCCLSVPFWLQAHGGKDVRMVGGGGAWSREVFCGKGQSKMVQLGIWIRKAQLLWKTHQH